MLNPSHYVSLISACFAKRHRPGCAGFFVAGMMILSGCTEPHGPLVVTDPDPSIKIPAIEKAAREKNFKAISQLIIELDSDDSAVRMYANHALETITGTETGYRYFDDEDHRRPAIALWRDWQSKHADNTTTSGDVTVTHTGDSH